MSVTLKLKRHSPVPPGHVLSGQVLVRCVPNSRFLTPRNELNAFVLVSPEVEETTVTVEPAWILPEDKTYTVESPERTDTVTCTSYSLPSLTASRSITQVVHFAGPSQQN